MPKPKKLRPYTVYRVLEEVYKVEALTKADAITRAAADGNPVSVFVRSERAIFEGGNPLPPGYVALQIF